MAPDAGSRARRDNEGERGSGSEIEALRVGATIEDLDIRDIVQILERTEDVEVARTYRALLCGSRSHMRAFSRLLAARGKT